MSQSQQPVTYHLALQHTYKTVGAALCQNGAVLHKKAIDKTDASAHLLATITTLLTQQNIELAGCAFIAVNQGPGPFTTLRAVIATANGIGFATGIPLVGIDGLQALLAEHSTNKVAVTVALLNAFGNDLYFAVQASADHPFVPGYRNAQLLIEELATHFGHGPVHFLGNGARMHAALITQHFGDRAVFPEPFPETCSIEQISQIGWQTWQRKHPSTVTVQPLYLKQWTLSNPQR